MKVFTKNAIIKKILIVLVTIIMISNFIMPNYVCAISAGEKVVSGFSYLLAWVGDIAISTMQGLMIGDNNIKNENDEYMIKYSPGIIFSNNVLALDINFIDPSRKKIDKVIKNEETSVIASNTYGANISGGIYSSDPSIVYEGESLTTSTTTHTKGDGGTQEKQDELFELYGYNIATDREKTSSGSTIGQEVYKWTNPNDGKKYELTVTISTPSGRSLKRSIALKIVGDNSTASPSTGSPSEDAQNRVEQLLNQHGYNQSSSNIIQNGEKTGGLANRTITYEWTTATGENYILTNVYKQGTADVSWTVTLKAKGVSIEKQGTITSTALELQGNIATWYLALRTIALVGLMSVLVYIGIRIILSSTSSQDKAKYKNMLKDWFVAICILFLLHYAMAFMLEFIGSLNNIIKSNVISEGLDGTTSDKLISTIRNQIGSDLNEAVQSDNVAGKIVMYLALVILTGVFTVQYLKRVIYMAFLTMIAPMIALTYPLDKIKDGKAQAFSYWVREYIFNCLIQPVHLLIYTIFINNAIDFAKENILYAIVALAFMVPAEKFIKEMFGMKSNSPTGTLGAAAGGALVMSMLNKVKAKPPKDGADGAGAGASGNANAVRAASNNGGSQPPIPGGSQPPISGGSQPPIPGGGQPPISGGGQAPTQENGQSPISEGGQAPIPGGQTQWTPSIRQKVAQSRVGRAVSRGGQQLIKNQANALKSTGKWVGKTVKALPGAALGATVGLAATVASGGENAGKFIGGGALGGAALSQNLINDSTNGVGDAIKKGWIGTEEYDNRKAKKTFFASEAYRQIKEDPTINQENIRERTATFINNGITDGKVIREAMQNGIEGETYSAFNKEGITSVKDIKALNESGINVEQIKEIKTYSGETDAKKMLRYSAIAKAAKDAGVPNDEESFINWARMHHRMDDGDAKKLFKQVKYYWN